MKLALFFTFKNGLETWKKIGSLEREVKPYQKLEHKVFFFTYDKKEVSLEGINVFKRKTFNLLHSILLPFIYRKELKDVDILKTNQMSGSWTAVLAKKIYKKKLVVRCGYEWLNVLEKEKKCFLKRKIVSLIERIAYKNADKIIFTSRKDRDFAIKRFNIALSKIEIIPNYIDTDVFKPLEIAKENRIIFVGRLSKEKNLFNLVRALKGFPLKLVLAGEGEEKQRLRDYAKANEVVVEFLGRIENKELPQELSKSRIFVLPSFYEGCPKALLEAMSCGLNCLGTNVEGIKEIIKDKENGVLTGIDAIEIRKGLDFLLKNDFGSGARNTILKDFSLDKILEKEQRIYEEILN